jgi:hypothetical protein
MKISFFVVGKGADEVSETEGFNDGGRGEFWVVLVEAGNKN